MATAPSPNDLTRQQLDELDALLQRMLSVPLPSDALPSSVPGGTASSGRDAHGSSAAARGGEGGAALADPPLPPSWRVDPPAPSRPSSAPGGGFASGGRESSAPAPHLVLTDPPSSVSLKFEPPAPAPLTQTPAPTGPLKPVAKTVPPPVPTPKVPPPPPTAQTVVAPPLPKLAPAVAPAPIPPPVPKAERGLTPAPTAPPMPFLFLPFVAFNALFDAGCGLFGPPGRVLRSGFFKQLYGLTGLGFMLYTAAHIAQGRGWVTLPVTLPWPR